jgi:hypothetical protein
MLRVENVALWKVQQRTMGAIHWKVDKTVPKENRQKQGK